MNSVSHAFQKKTTKLPQEKLEFLKSIAEYSDKGILRKVDMLPTNRQGFPLWNSNQLLRDTVYTIQLHFDKTCGELEKVHANRPSMAKLSGFIETTDVPAR